MPPIALIWLLLLSAPFTPLASGAQGPSVAALQTELGRLQLDPGPVDGQYGPETVSAVDRLESAAGLPTDGNASAAVLAAIVAKVAASAPLLQAGDSGAAVRDLQALLTADGLKLQADGTFGATTLAAVRQVQAQGGLTVDGLVGPETWSRIFTRSYTVQPGQTIDGLAQTLGLPASSLLAENGGKSLIFVGEQLRLAYAGAPAASAAKAAVSQGAPSGTSATSTSSGGSSTPKTSGGSGQVIPARTLAQWGGAGTPELGVVVLAEDQPSALALRHSLPSGMVLALPPSLYSLGGSSSVLLATSRLGDVQRTGAHAVLWQGVLSAKTLNQLSAQHVSVLIAQQFPPAAALGAASGGSVLAVPVHQDSLAALTTLARGLQRAGYRLVSPLP